MDWSGPTTSTSVVCMYAGLMIVWPVEYVGICVWSDVQDLVSHHLPNRSAVSSRRRGAFRPFSPFPALRRPRPQNRWHPWRIANRSLHHACVLYGLPLSRLTVTELHHTSMFCVVGMDISNELLFFWGATCPWIQYGKKDLLDCRG